jgi:mannose-6-phosphate isomerase-like protein (cupin superfamily)
MSDYTKVNLEDVENMAPKYGLGDGIEAHFARVPLELEQSGMSLFRLAPNFRFPFGHRHGTQEEIYVLVSGNARMKLDDEVVEMKPWDAIRVPGETMRCFEGGPDGGEIVAFGAPNTGGKDAEMEPGWWTD